MKNPFKRVTGVFNFIYQKIRFILHSKYIELILAVGLFILLDTGVLILNFYISYQITSDAHAIHLASKMGTVSQTMLEELYQVRDDAMNQEADYSKTIDLFAKTFKTFDETLDAFIYGGELIAEGQGNDALLQDKTYRDTNAHLLKEAEEIWKVYRVRLTPIVYAYFNDAERSDVIADADKAIAFARQNNDKLLNLMQSFASAVEGVAQRKAKRLRLIQSIGISLAVINFFLILFHVLKRLSQSDAQVEKARQETENILKNVNEGLFLLDQNYIIGSQYSESLHTLFKEESFQDQNFFDLMSPLVTEKTLETVKEYIEILFSPRVSESLVADLNPLNEVEINLSSEQAGFDVRYFSFQFSRVLEKGKYKTLLVTVKDITQQIELSQKLEKATQKASREIEMLLAIMHVSPAILNDFLEGTGKGLTMVNNILKVPDKDSGRLKSKLDTISRIIHKLKGDSTSLGLEFIEEKFHGYESILAPLKEKEVITGEDFLPLVVHLNQLLSDFQLIKTLQEKIITGNLAEISSDHPKIRHKKTSDAVVPDDSSTLQTRLTNLVQRVAQDHGKEVELDMAAFDVSLLTDEQFAVAQDITIQCLRNAVVHGIESSSVRETCGKPRKGRLTVALQEKESKVCLTVKDDGQGINLDKIKTVAVSKGIVSQELINDWTSAKLLTLMFRQGFSTADDVNGRHAGRGVGMDVVKTRLDSIGGKIMVGYRPGKYTEFKFVFSRLNQLELAKIV